MSELLGRFRYPVTYVLLSCVCLVGMTLRRDPHPLGWGSSAILALTLPLERMVALPVREVRDLWHEYVDLVGVRERNEILAARVHRLEEENLRFREAMVSVERLQRLTGFRDRRDLPMVAANVVGRDLSAWFRSVIIDQGETAGIRPGMAVITDAGVVGVVSGTTRGAAKILSIVDPQSRVDAYIQRSRAGGMVRGASSDEVYFDYALREEDVRIGDRLLTSGLGAVYPKGILVGQVSRVESQPYGLFQKVFVEPAVDLGKLEQVFVILEKRDLPDPEEFAAPDENLFTGFTDAVAEAPADISVAAEPPPGGTMR